MDAFNDVCQTFQTPPAKRRGKHFRAWNGIPVLNLDVRILAESAKIIRRHFRECRPACGLILGTGWETAVEEFVIKGRLPYERLAALGKTNVAGHNGVLFRAELSGIETFIFQGRHHWYEGLGWNPIALPVYILKQFGAAVLVLTNSAGGIRPDLQRGMLMVIEDHINAMGVNPLQGRHAVFFGKRFADQTAVYDPRLRSLLKRSARQFGIRLKEGVYIGVPGPVYETPAEVRAFKRLGADAVGMSTVPEAILANAAGLRVAGLSLMANAAARVGQGALDHEAVRNTGQRTKEKMRGLLREFWRALALMREV